MFRRTRPGIEPIQTLESPMSHRSSSALRGLAAAAVLGGTLFASTPAAFADYPNITPGGGTGSGTIPTSGGGMTAGGGAAGGGSLPFTGAEILPLVGAGSVLLLTGTVALAAGRRRRVASPA